MNTSKAKRVLVTGAAGNIGRTCCRGLVERGHHVVGFDRSDKAPAGLADYVQGDLSDPDTLEQLCQDVDQVIHLAAVPGDADFMTKLLPANFIGNYHVFEAARKADVDRLIAVSTSQVVFGNEHEHCQVGVDAPPRPLNHYAASKVWMEALANMYVQTHGMSILVVRPGWVPDQPITIDRMGKTKRQRCLYWSHNDTARFFTCAVEAEQPAKPGLATVFGRSRSEDEAVGLDPNPARNLLGYEAQDIYPEGSPFDEASA